MVLGSTHKHLQRLYVCSVFIMSSRPEYRRSRELDRSLSLCGLLEPRVAFKVRHLFYVKLVCFCTFFLFLCAVLPKT